MEDDKLFVRKIGNIERNIERLTFLQDNGYPVPKIYFENSEFLDMEYIHGLDIKNYLRSNGNKSLYEFIEDILTRFSANSIDKDYTEVYNYKLKWLDSSIEFPFTKEELIQKLPKVLPQSTYHGDMTLENILQTENGFVLIDPVTIEYDSYIFDIAKMRQDLTCKWFIRNDNIKIDVKLNNLQEKLLSKFPLSNNDALLILMLLRVYPYTFNNKNNQQFIMNNICRLWKNIK